MSVPVHAAPTSGAEPVLAVGDLHVSYGDSAAVHGVSFDLYPGETLGIVGESGSGKSTTVMALTGLLPGSAGVAGSVRYRGRDLITASARDLRRIRGRRFGIVYQDSLRALNPVMRVGRQIAEVFEAHGDPDAADERAVALLSQVGIPHSASRARMYPHEFSGGMRQRAMIAMALAYSPDVLIADEPTTALDVTIQAQILELVQSLASDSQTATILVTHDLGVIAQMCNRVLVMYAGRVVESGEAEELFERPKHPYTISLLRSMPKLGATRSHRLEYIPGQPPEASGEITGCAFAPRCYAAEPQCTESVPELVEVRPGHGTACLVTLDDPSGRPPLPADSTSSPIARATDQDRTGAPSDAIEAPIVELRNVSRYYRTKASLWSAPETVRAVDDVSLTISPGQSVGLVGESGSGKSTLGRVIAGLERPTSGRMIFDGRDVTGLSGSHLRRFRKRAQLIYQDPRNSLNRRMTVRSILNEALKAADTNRRRGPETAAELLELVGLSPRHADRYPSEFSGGQAQRIAIARALAVEPSFVVADEAVSALDVSIQGQILNLLVDLQERLGLSFLFISHDLAVVQQTCDRVAVMYFGKVIEVGRSEEIFTAPVHPYSLALRSAHPVPEPAQQRSRSRIVLTGDIPNPSDPPDGCRFHPRCPIGPTARSDRDVCVTTPPELEEVWLGRWCACHFPGEFEDLDDG